MKKDYEEFLKENKEIIEYIKDNDLTNLIEE